MQLLTPEDWLAAVKQPDLETEEDFRKAFATLRNTAQHKLGALLQPALSKFLKANNGDFPTDVSQLLTYLEGSVDPSVLGRYAMMPASAHPNVVMGGDLIITQVAPVDRELDQRIVIGPRGYGSSSYPRAGEPSKEDIQTLNPALKAFQAANNGREPLDPTHIEPFLTTAEQKAAYKRFVEFRATQKK